MAPHGRATEQVMQQRARNRMLINIGGPVAVALVLLVALTAFFLPSPTPLSAPATHVSEQPDMKAAAAAKDTADAAAKKAKEEQAVREGSVKEAAAAAELAATEAKEAVAEEAEVAREQAGHEHDPNCKDTQAQCRAWAEKGECTQNVEFMTVTCCYSCAVHGKTTAVAAAEAAAAAAAADANADANAAAQAAQEAGCSDRNPTCSHWVEIGECESNTEFMLVTCCHSCREHQASEAARKAEAAAAAAADAAVEAAAAAAEESPGCKDQHEDCAGWAQAGECTANAQFMGESCCHACREYVAEQATAAPWPTAESFVGGGGTGGGGRARCGCHELLGRRRLMRSVGRVGRVRVEQRLHDVQLLPLVRAVEADHQARALTPWASLARDARARARALDASGSHHAYFVLDDMTCYPARAVLRCPGPVDD